MAYIHHPSLLLSGSIIIIWFPFRKFRYTLSETQFSYKCFDTFRYSGGVTRQQCKLHPG